MHSRTGPSITFKSMIKPTKKTSVKTPSRVIYSTEQFKKDQAASRKAQPIFEAWGL